MSRYVVNATWDDAAHLTPEMKAREEARMLPHQRDARMKGVPMLGVGRIYPISEEEFLIDDFPIPRFWPKAYALDVGWNKTAAVWGAIDDQADTVYIYAEYYRGEAEPPIHATAIKAKGDWIPGVIDPAARGRSQGDGSRLIEHYADLGLMLAYADNSVETGLLKVWERLSSGRLKVFRSCINWLSEFRRYRREERGQDGNARIVKKDDHLMDATRYLCLSGLQFAMTPPSLEQFGGSAFEDHTRNRTTGY